MYIFQALNTGTESCCLQCQYGKLFVNYKSINSPYCLHVCKIVVEPCLFCKSQKRNLNSNVQVQQHRECYNLLDSDYSLPGFRSPSSTSSSLPSLLKWHDIQNMLLPSIILAVDMSVCHNKIFDDGRRLWELKLMQQ